jgi:hypothetical protein
VYDKKLLWRANLYIDEGGGDWNNAHPWVTTTAENNWYRTTAQGATVNGGQINLEEWSSIREGGDMSRSVAYSYPESASSPYHMDDPFQFNEKMQRARSLIQKWYSNASNPPLQGFTTQTLGNWLRTIAPSSDWYNYRRQAYSDLSPALPGLGLIQLAAGRINNQAAINEILGGTATLTAEWAALAAGTDCIGFAQNAASYTGNSYKWPDLPTGPRAYPRTQQDAQAANRTRYGFLLQDWDDYESAGRTLSGIPVVPGDIMYYGNGDHIAIVHSIEQTGDQLNLGHIRLIEAVAIHSANPVRRFRHVILEQTLMDIHEAGRQWRLVRLEHQ